MQPTPPPEPPPRGFTWPILLNLLLLVAVAATLGTQALPGTVLGLVLLNLLAGILMAFKKRLRYVSAFLLAALVVLLVGLGFCALLLAGH